MRMRDVVPVVATGVRVRFADVVRLVVGCVVVVVVVVVVVIVVVIVVIADVIATAVRRVVVDDVILAIYWKKKGCIGLFGL